MKKFKYLFAMAIMCISAFYITGCKDEKLVYTVELPTITSGCGYELLTNVDIDTETNTFDVDSKNGYNISFAIDDCYDINKLIIKANGEIVDFVKDTTNNIVTISDNSISANTKITIENLVKKELTFNFKLVEYSNDSISYASSSNGLDEINIKINDIVYSLNQLIQENLSFKISHTTELLFSAGCNTLDKYTNIQDLFLYGDFDGKLHFDNTTNSYPVPSTVSNIVKKVDNSILKDESGWTIYSLNISENSTIYINNGGLKIDQKYLITNSNLEFKTEQIDLVYGNEFNPTDYISNPNNINFDDIKVDFYANGIWTNERPISVGEYKIRLTFDGNDYFYPIEKESVFNITKRNIVLDFKNYEITYGQPIPDIEITENKNLSQGFAYDDSILDISVICIPQNVTNISFGTNKPPVGVYDLGIMFNNKNYNLTINSVGTLTVVPAKLPNNIVSFSNINTVYDRTEKQLNINKLDTFSESLSISYRKFMLNNNERIYDSETTLIPTFRSVFSGGVEILVKSKNFKNKTFTAFVNITKATIENNDIIVENIETTFDGNPKTFNIQFSDKLLQEDFSITFNNSSISPTITNANVNNVDYFEITFSNPNYFNYTITRYIKINKANLTIDKLPTYSKMFVGDKLSNIKLENYSILGVNNNSIQGTFDFIDDNIIDTTTFKTNSIKFIPTDPNYNEIVLSNFTISATQLTLTIPTGVIVLSIPTNETLSAGVHNVLNNSKYQATFENLSGYTFTNLKANNNLLTNENDCYNFNIANESIIITRDYTISDLSISNLENLIDIKYNYGNTMGSLSIQATHELSADFNFNWYKLKPEYYSNIDTLNPLKENLDTYFTKLDNNTNVLNITKVEENGFYLVTVDLKISDIDNNQIEFFKISNLAQVTTKKLRVYISTDLEYTAKTNMNISEIIFTGGNPVDENNNSVQGNFYIVDSDNSKVSADGTTIEIIFEPSDVNNFYFDQSSNDGIQNKSIVIYPNCYTYTFIYLDGTIKTHLVKANQNFTIPEAPKGKSWFVTNTNTGDYITFVDEFSEIIIGITDKFILDDLTFEES